MSEPIENQPAETSPPIFAITDIPYYQCHKTVQACKILDVPKPIPDATHYILTTDPITIGPIVVSLDYIEKHRPEAGGYYIRYADGYESYSPAAAFESGYTLIEPAGAFRKELDREMVVFIDSQRNTWAFPIEILAAAAIDAMQPGGLLHNPESLLAEGTTIADMLDAFRDSPDRAAQFLDLGIITPQHLHGHLIKVHSAPPPTPELDFEDATKSLYIIHKAAALSAQTPVQAEPTDSGNSENSTCDAAVNEPTFEGSEAALT